MLVRPKYFRVENTDIGNLSFVCSKENVEDIMSAGEMKTKHGVNDGCDVN